MAPPIKEYKYQTHSFTITPTLRDEDWEELKAIMNENGSERVLKKTMFRTRTYVRVPNFDRYIDRAKWFFKERNYRVWDEVKEDPIRWPGATAKPKRWMTKYKYYQTEAQRKMIEMEKGLNKK